MVNDTNANTSVLVSGENVTIIPSSGKHTVGSSKVKLKNLVDYSWEHKFYPGQILAIHISGKYVAYGIQGKFCLCRIYNNIQLYIRMSFRKRERYRSCIESCNIGKSFD